MDFSLHWVLFVFAWAFGEFMEYIMTEKNFHERIKTGAKWAFVVSIISFYIYGDASSGGTVIIKLLVSAFISIAIIYPIYFFRVKALKIIAKKFGMSFTELSMPAGGNGSLAYFHISNVASQLAAIVLGFAAGFFMISVVFVLFMVFVK